MGEPVYAFARNLLAKLPPPDDGQGFVLDDKVALRFYRLQQVKEGSIALGKGEPDRRGRGKGCLGLELRTTGCAPFDTRLRRYSG